MASRGRTIVEDNDLGWAAFMRSLENFRRDKAVIVAGVIGPEGEATHSRSKLQESVAAIAARNEFGLGVPERSFLRRTFDEKRDKYHDYLARGVQRELVQAAKTRTALSAETSITHKRLGLRIEGDVKRKIASHIPPPNSPATIAAKGSSTPLIWTGQTRRAVSSAVRKHGGVK